MTPVNAGFGNMLNAERILGVLRPDSAPVKRIMQTAKDDGKLIDVTQGRKTASVIIMDSEHVVLSYLKPEKIAERLGITLSDYLSPEEEI